MLGVLALYLAKRFHNSIEIKPYSLKLSLRLICPKGSGTVHEGLKAYLVRCARDIFLGLDRSSVGCQIMDAILIHLLSLFKTSQHLRQLLTLYV